MLGPSGAVRPGPIWHHTLVTLVTAVPGRGPRRTPLPVLALLLLRSALLTGLSARECLDRRLPDDLVSGSIVAAVKPRNDDKGPQFDENLAFSQKVSVSPYETDGYVGSRARFSDLTFAELPNWPA